MNAKYRGASGCNVKQNTAVNRDMVVLDLGRIAIDQKLFF
jgi:hypothetical protein